MGALNESRLELETALDAAGVVVGNIGAPINPPCALVRPGDPWIEPASVGGGMVDVAWSVLLVAGVPDAASTLADLETLAELALPAIRGLRGWTSGRVARAGAGDLQGATYLISDIRLATPVELTAL